MKKLILITTLIACVCAFAIMHTDDSDAAVVASGTCGTNLNWEYDDATTTLTISGSGTTMYTGSWYDEVPWYSYRSQIAHVIFNTSNPVTISTYAFARCSNLLDIEFGSNGITQIGNDAFIGCTKLGYVALPNGLTSIGDSAFNGCTNLTLAELPSSLITIGGATFSNCTKLVLTQLPNSITTLGNFAFSDTKVSFSSLPSSLMTIRQGVFQNCRDMPLTLIIYCTPSSLVSDSVLFSGSSVTTLINLGTSDWSATGKTILTPTATGTCGTNLNWAYVGDNTTLYVYGSGLTMTDYSLAGAPWFTYQASISNIQFDCPNLTNIGKYAFGHYTTPNCYKNVTVFNIPSTVTTLGEGAFNNAKSTSFNFPANLKVIGNSAFEFTKVNWTELPSGVTTIGARAFFNCTDLTSITIPSFITTVGYDAFRNCSNLQHIEWDVPNYTGTWASNSFPFTGCTGIVDVTIGENVESLPNWLFYENSAVTTWTTIYWNAINCADFTSDNMIFHNDKIHTIIFGDNVKHVPAYLTREFNDTLESVSFNDGLESIGDGAFQNSAIVVLGLPSTLKSVGVWSFSNCPNVMIRTLPVGMESIGSNAFANCSGITEMLIPVGFSATISDGAFANDTNLKTVLNLSDLNIEKGATTYGSIGAYADEVRNDIPSIGIVQQKDHIVHETIEKTDMASTLLRILPALMVIAILSFIIGALYYRSREQNFD